MADAVKSEPDDLNIEGWASKSQEELHVIVRTVHQLLEAFGTGRVEVLGSEQAASTSSEIATPVRIHELQKTYQQASVRLRDSIQKCCSLLGDAQAPSTSVQDPAAASELSLERTALIRQIEERNETIKQLIDNFRHMLDGLQMWSAYRTKLDMLQQAAQR